MVLLGFLGSMVLFVGRTGSMCVRWEEGRWVRWCKQSCEMIFLLVFSCLSSSIIIIRSRAINRASSIRQGLSLSSHDISCSHLWCFACWNRCVNFCRYRERERALVRECMGEYMQRERERTRKKRRNCEKLPRWEKQRSNRTSPLLFSLWYSFYLDTALILLLSSVLILLSCCFHSDIIALILLSFSFCSHLDNSLLSFLLPFCPALSWFSLLCFCQDYWRNMWERGYLDDINALSCLCFAFPFFSLLLAVFTNPISSNRFVFRSRKRR